MGEKERDSTLLEHSDDGELADLRAQNAELSACTVELRTEVSSLKEAVSRLEGMLKKETERVGEMWRMNCAQVYAFDEAITAKDSEIITLRAKVAELQAPPGSPPMDSTATVPEQRPFIHPQCQVHTQK